MQQEQMTSVASFDEDVDIQIVENTEEDVVCFKTSLQPQHRELKAFINNLLTDPFNHFCLNCKQNESTHGMVWHGAFICEQCAHGLRRLAGGQHELYIKSLFNEQWDDYQLKSLALGGNHKIFDIMLEYNLEKNSFFQTYKHPSLVWYKHKHVARIDGRPFDKAKPAKTWAETFS